jgi:hypothetical protein
MGLRLRCSARIWPASSLLDLLLCSDFLQPRTNRPPRGLFQHGAAHTRRTCFGATLILCYGIADASKPLAARGADSIYVLYIA